MGELILIVFFALGFFLMGILYYQERKRRENDNWYRNYYESKWRYLKDEKERRS